MKKLLAGLAIILSCSLHAQQTVVNSSTINDLLDLVIIIAELTGDKDIKIFSAENSYSSLSLTPMRISDSCL